MAMHGIPASKLSDKGGQIKFGDKVGISFDLGQIDCKYGKLENGSGILPLMLPFGEFVIPPIVTNPEELKKLAKVIRAEFGNLWEDMLDEEIEEKLLSYIILSALCFCSSGVDMWSEEGKYAIVGHAVMIELDDLIDDLDDLENSGLDFKGFMAFYDKFVSGNPDEASTLMPKLVPYTKFLIEWADKNPNKSRMRWARKEAKNSMNALATLSTNGKYGKEGLSEDALLEFNGFLFGLLGGLEMAVLYKEGDVCEEIREDIVFQRFARCVAICGTLMNAIFGLGRDIRMDQVKDTPILRDVVNKGIPLQKAFEKYIHLFYNFVQDLSVLGKMLKARYPDDPALIHYVNLGQEIIDQQLFWYMFITRYGETNAKVQKM
jgi:hypothetical protein